MKRIGLAASVISKGNLTLYNIYVILIAALFSLFIFIIAGSTVIFALAIIQYVGNEVMGGDFEHGWQPILGVCMAALTIVIVLFNVMAVLQNLKLPKIKG